MNFITIKVELHGMQKYFCKISLVKLLGLHGISLRLFILFYQAFTTTKSSPHL